MPNFIFTETCRDISGLEVEYFTTHLHTHSLSIVPILYRVVAGLEPIPGYWEHWGIYSLGWQFTAGHKLKHTLTLAHTMAVLNTPTHGAITRMCLDCVRKPEWPEETHKSQGEHANPMLLYVSSEILNCTWPPCSYSAFILLFAFVM